MVCAAATENIGVVVLIQWEPHTAQLLHDPAALRQNPGSGLKAASCTASISASPYPNCRRKDKPPETTIPPWTWASILCMSEETSVNK